LIQSGKHLQFISKCATIFSAVIFFNGFISRAQSPAPNIIYIMADDLGYADLGCYGKKEYQTPNIDRLAAGGIKFINAYSAAPVCTPTRTAFMTGRYPARTPVGLREPLDWNHADSLVGLTPQYPSLAAALQKAGYETLLVGFSPEFNPNRNGFDYFFGHHGGGVDYVSHLSTNKENDLYENGKSIHREGYLTDILKDKAVELISKKHDKPFFMALMFNAPHWPWQSPGDPPYPDTMDWKKGGSPKTYAAMIKSLDDAVGKIVQVLTEGQLDKNTLIIFTSDNGGEKYSDMGPYQGKKQTLWEGGIRVPAIMYWPGKIKAGTVSSQAVITMDWTSTILSLAGATLPGKVQSDGMNILPFAQGKKSVVSRTFYWRQFQRFNQKAIRDGDWKYMQDEQGVEYLFDLGKDPVEKNNLKTSNASVFANLKKKYAEWESRMLTPVPLNK
jgi:arylsulfatase A-like enzyme